MKKKCWYILTNFFVYIYFTGHKCPFYAKDGMGILESPNFPGEYPAGAECHWRVRPNRNRRVLVIISSIHLDDSCGDVLTIRKTGRQTMGPIIYFIEGRSPSRHKWRFCI